MILIAVVGLAFVVGMPYLLDNSTYLPSNAYTPALLYMLGELAELTLDNLVDPEMRAEFEEQQKKSVLSGGAGGANPLQNFDMAAWMAGKTSGTESGS